MMLNANRCNRAEGHYWVHILTIGDKRGDHKKRWECNYCGTQRMDHVRQGGVTFKYEYKYPPQVLTKKQFLKLRQELIDQLETLKLP